MCICFGLLAISTSFNIFLDILCKARPPVVCCDKLVCFEISGVAGQGMVMAARDNVVVEGSGGWDVHSSLVSEECYA